MVKKKKQKRVVGSKNIVRTAIPKPMDDLILEFKIDYEKKNGKKVSKQWAALQLTMEIDKKKWF